MATYAVTQRLTGGRPRRATTARADVEDPRLAQPDDEREAPLSPATIDLVGWDPWLRASELWRQTTFYLFDADGWR